MRSESNFGKYHLYRRSIRIVYHGSRAAIDRSLLSRSSSDKHVVKRCA
jgi:hypothetical protein